MSTAENDAPRVSLARTCCCKPCDPEANLVVRCLPRAMDMGHCRGTDFGQEFCCGGETAPIPPEVGAETGETDG